MYSHKFLTHQKGEYLMDNTNTIWKPIAGYDGKYDVSNDGQVRRKKNNGEYSYLSPCLQDDGYLRVLLSTCDHKQKFAAVHILMADAFIPNPENKKYVIFKDDDKTHCVIDNLVRATWAERTAMHSDNPDYLKRKRSHKQYGVLCTTTGQKYDSLRSAADALAISSTNITLCIRENRSTRAGYSFKYFDKKTHEIIESI